MKKIFKIIFIIITLLHILGFILVNTFYIDMNYLPLLVIEIINIIFGIIIFKKDENKWLYLSYILFVIATFFIPVYEEYTIFWEDSGRCWNMYAMSLVNLIK